MCAHGCVDLLLSSSLSLSVRAYLSVAFRFLGTAPVRIDIWLVHDLDCAAATDPVGRPASTTSAPVPVLGPAPAHPLVPVAPNATATHLFIRTYVSDSKVISDELVERCVAARPGSTTPRRAECVASMNELFGGAILSPPAGPTYFPSPPDRVTIRPRPAAARRGGPSSANPDVTVTFGPGGALRNRPSPPRCPEMTERFRWVSLAPPLGPRRWRGYVRR